MVVPRFLPGVPSALNKAVMVDDVALLQPYPNWDLQELGDRWPLRFKFDALISTTLGLDFFQLLFDRQLRSYTVFAEHGDWPWYGAYVGTRHRQKRNIHWGSCERLSSQTDHHRPQHRSGEPRILCLTLVLDTNEQQCSRKRFLRLPQVIDRFEFSHEIASRDGNYLNDLVVDPVGGFVYISDSGVGSTGHFGGIIGEQHSLPFFTFWYGLTFWGAKPLHTFSCLLKKCFSAKSNWRTESLITFTPTWPLFCHGDDTVYNLNTRTAHRLEDASMLPEEGADDMEIGGDIYNFDIPVNGITLSPDKSQLHYSAISVTFL